MWTQLNFTVLLLSLIWSLITTTLCSDPKNPGEDLKPVDAPPEIFGGRSREKFIEDFLATRHDCGGCVCKYPCFEQHCVEPQSCFNGGKVVLDGDGKVPVCLCPKYFEGQCCKEKVCAGGSVLRDGTCECKYSEFQFGEHCEKPRCQHGGMPAEGYCRNCPWLWEGPFCEQMKCVHGGVRNDTDGSQGCQCPDNNRFYGDHCQRVLCDHGGIENMFSGNCECTFLFWGPFCEELNKLAWGLIFSFVASFILILIYCCWKPIAKKCIEMKAEANYKTSISTVQLLKVNSTDELDPDGIPKPVII